MIPENNYQKNIEKKKVNFIYQKNTFMPVWKKVRGFGGGGGGPLCRQG